MLSFGVKTAKIGIADPEIIVFEKSLKNKKSKKLMQQNV